MTLTRPSTEQQRERMAPNASPQRAATRSGNRALSILTYKRPKSDMLCCGASSFGRDAPKITIGCSRPEPVFPNRNPGPGAYTPVDPGEHKKIYYKIPRSVKKERAIDTADVEFINGRIFPSINPKTISKTGHQDYFSFDAQIPGPSYLPPTTISHKGHKIEPIRKAKDPSEFVPGPGFYDPQYEHFRVTFYNSESPRNTDHNVVEKTPGPGAYNPNFYAELTVMPKWSIGKKGRFKRRRKNDPPVVPKGKMIGVAQFLVQIDPSMDEREAFRYVAKNPDLKALITELMDQILEDKPDDPIMFIRDYFMTLRNLRKHKF